ncbi:MAG TPA: gliding motility-associated C-terminal domain-containing protein [Puia sp.]|nr:gliding motility-associated C-terminal domain-containing protein [Puia sp.]
MVLATLAALPSAGQSQSCPININFSATNLTHWEAYTGNNKAGNGPGAIIVVYDSSQNAPNGTIGASALPEFDLPGVNGIQVITSQGTDPFGSFPTIPTINGYTYKYSVLLGSTSVAVRQAGDPGNGPLGGYVRGISYLINVPNGPPTLPYTMTYAYAMVLENGTHASEDQPMARAIVTTSSGVITCASPAYFLPTYEGELDSATARANGFTPSPVPTPNVSLNAQNVGQHLQDVWTKGWTEVTFDLSAYRGQQVSLTFEADNCVPGGHFAYAYFALRDNCGGLQISGDTLACINSIETYSVPALDSGSISWSVPAGWTMTPGGSQNSIVVRVGAQPGPVAVSEQNSCTTLNGSLFVDLYPGALPQASIDPRDTTVCYGATVPLQALITTGTEYTWTSPGSFVGGDRRTGGAGGPISSLPFTAKILATPDQTTNYILNIQNAGCPIPISDTIAVTVVPPIKVNAGNDTLVVVDQPLQFQATSTDPYKDDFQWTPSTDLSSPDVADPVAQYAAGITNITYEITATDSFGCYGTGTVKVTIADALADIYVPNAFTPGSGSNNVFRPVCFGMATLDYFRVYSRWGQLIFGTTQMGQGWDGRIQGRLQDSGTYMWEAKGTDYTGRVISKRGTVVLIR